MGIAFAWVSIVVGALTFLLGIANASRKKYAKKEAEKYTKESLEKMAVVDGVTTSIAGLGLVLAGICDQSMELVSVSWLTWVGWGVAIVCLLGSYIAEPKILKKIEK